MDAIVSGKVEKQVKGLVFNQIQRYYLPSTGASVQIENLPSFLNTNTEQYYVKFNVNGSNIFYISNLEQCKSSTSSNVYYQKETGAMNIVIYSHRHWIFFTYFTYYNMFGISDQSSSMSISNSIPSIDIGTLE